MSTIRNRLRDLRALMLQAGIEAYLVPSTDPHQSEYVPDCWQRRQWLSGFTGSAGDLVVTRSTAGLWTDGRYFLQAGQELKGSTIKLFKQGQKGVPTIPVWLAATLRQGQAVGADPRLLSSALEGELQGALGPAGVSLKLIEENLVDRLWLHRPSAAKAPIEVLPRWLTGLSVAAKLRQLRQEMARRRVDAHVLTALDTIAWLFNIRSQDVEYNPVAIAYAVVTRDRAILFTDPDKVSPRVRRALGKVEIRHYDETGAALTALARQRPRVWVDARSANLWVINHLRGCALLREPSPILLLKARKNAAEIAGIRRAHLQDGRAMVRFLCWLESAVPGGGVTEISAAEKLLALRSEGESFRGESFGAIAAYGAHGAIIHYSATPQSNATLEPRGIFLIDSGGQYLDGTTDITRTVLLGGEATAEQRDRFTRVLRGHIAVARCRFPVGTPGRAIDTLARAPLWEAGLNYAHGTGHGVGFYLNVHEGPQAISPTRCTGVPLEEGNVLSNEPGFYQEGGYGIRIENLILTQKDEASKTGDPFLRFDVITLCPIDARLIDPAQLTIAELEWLDGYHARVRQALAPELDRDERAWLERATRPLGS